MGFRILGQHVTSWGLISLNQLPLALYPKLRPFHPFIEDGKPSKMVYDLPKESCNTTILTLIS